MKLRTLGVALLLVTAVARPAVAQRYSARRTGDVVRLEDATSGTVVSMAPGVGNMAFEMNVRGTNVLWWPFSSVEDFKAKPAMSGIPFLGPWANRLDEQAFYANGVRYPFDMALGNVRGAIPIHGFLTTNPHWQLIEARADAASAWATSRLEFYRQPAWMKQFPFAHTIDMTYRLQNGVLEVVTLIRNMAAEPMPVAIGFHPYFRLADSPRDEWTVSVGARTRWLLASNKVPTGVDAADRAAVSGSASGRAARLRSRRRVFGSDSGCIRPRGDVGQRQGAEARRRVRRTLAIGRRLGAEAHRPGPGSKLHLLRADGGDYQRDEHGPEGPLPRTSEHPAWRDLAGKLLDPPERILRGTKGQRQKAKGKGSGPSCPLPFALCPLL